MFGKATTPLAGYRPDSQGQAVRLDRNGFARTARHVVLGSETQRLLTHSTIPVLVIR